MCVSQKQRYNGVPEKPKVSRYIKVILFKTDAQRDISEQMNL